MNVHNPKQTENQKQTDKTPREATIRLLDILGKTNVLRLALEHVNDNHDDLRGLSDAADTINADLINLLDVLEGVEYSFKRMELQLWQSQSP